MGGLNELYEIVEPLDNYINSLPYFTRLTVGTFILIFCIAMVVFAIVLFDRILSR